MYWIIARRSVDRLVILCEPMDVSTDEEVIKSANKIMKKDLGKKYALTCIVLVTKEVGRKEMGEVKIIKR